MKKIITVLAIVGISYLLAISCAEPKKNQPKYEASVTSTKQAELVGETRYGYLYKLKDGNNTIYIYERGGGAGSITVVKEN